jgi:hypothetical protein
MALSVVVASGDEGTGDRISGKARAALVRAHRCDYLAWIRDKV